MKPTRKMYECAAELIAKQPRLATRVWYDIGGPECYYCIGGAVMACSTKRYELHDKATEEALEPLSSAKVPYGYEHFTDWNDAKATVTEAAQFLRDIAKTLPEE